MSLKGRLILGAIDLLPEKHISRAVRALAKLPAPVAVRQFASMYNIAVDEAELPIDAYPSVLEFFTRRLKPGLRPIDPDPKVFVSPVDGVLDATGPVDKDRILQAKGRDYSVAALITDAALAQRFEGGSYATLYLSPKDYHRTHTPVSGLISRAIYVPGALFPVNPNAVANVDALFANNERLVIIIESPMFGTVAYVMVGATCVGHIKTAFDATIATNTGGRELKQHVYDPPIPVERGGELGVFELGSTVIVVVEKGMAFDASLAGSPVKLGQRIGTKV